MTPFWAILHHTDDPRVIGGEVRDVALLVTSVGAESQAAGWAFHDPATSLPQPVLGLGNGQGLPLPPQPLPVAKLPHSKVRRAGTWRRMDEEPEAAVSLLH